MTAIALDRYLVIVKAHAMSKLQYILLVIVSWLYAFTWIAPPLFGWGRFVPEGAGTMCSFDYISRDKNNRSYVICIYIFQFVLPLTLMIYLYTKVCVHVRSHVKYMHQLTTRLNIGLHGSISTDQRHDILVAKTTCLLVVIFCVSWSPYAIVALIGQFGDVNLITPLVSIVPGVIAKCSTAYNPIVYCLMLPKFRLRLLQMVRSSGCLPHLRQKTSSRNTERTIPMLTKPCSS